MASEWSDRQAILYYLEGGLGELPPAIIHALEVAIEEKPAEGEARTVRGAAALPYLDEFRALDRLFLAIRFTNNLRICTQRCKNGAMQYRECSWTHVDSQNCKVALEAQCAQLTDQDLHSDGGQNLQAHGHDAEVAH
ncbi:MAG: hypothetical protein WD534_06970 [Phycisphaeraceae bacterium]